jgi:hypothetical protein
VKVKFEAIFEVPDSFAEMTDSELRMTFYEEFLRTAHQAHMEHVLEFADVVRDNNNFVGKNTLLPGEAEQHERTDKILAAAREHSLQWAGITDVPDWWISKL